MPAWTPLPPLTWLGGIEGRVWACLCRVPPEDADGVVHHKELLDPPPLAGPYQSYTVQRSVTLADSEGPRLPPPLRPPNSPPLGLFRDSCSSAGRGPLPSLGLPS